MNLMKSITVVLTECNIFVSGRIYENIKKKEKTDLSARLPLFSHGMVDK